MTRKAWIITLGGIITAFAFYPAHRETPEQAIAHSISAQVASFDSLVGGPFIDAVKDDAGQAKLQSLFLETRLAYKRWEWAAEYWSPALARQINGEPVPEADPIVTADPTSEGSIPGRFTVMPPQGMQVMESIIFPGYDTSRRQELLDHLDHLRGVARQFETYFNNIGLLPGQVFDAAKLEVFRLLTLGITGYDDPLTLHAMTESSAALLGLSTAIAAYPGSDSLSAQLKMARAYLTSHRDFNSFDRAFFITRFGNRLSGGIASLETQLHVPVIRYNRLLRQDAATLFEPGAFNADAYLPEDGTPTTPALVALGQRLFSDPVLSGPGIRSCASCHRPGMAFTDGLPRNTVLGGHVLLPRNTPTLLNAALQPAQFYDLRATSLEDQVRDVLHNPTEMQGSLGGVAAHIARDTVYKRLWTAAFSHDDALHPQAFAKTDTTWIVHALAAYVRSLVKLDSRFDLFMQGDSTQLSAREIRGFNLFMGKARCGTCHFMPLFNGAFPPLYNRTEAEVIGAPDRPGSGKVDPDEGQFNILPAPFLQHAFKTPTLRNIGLTAPYMHNGAFATLDQVVDLYDDGGIGEGGDLHDQTLPSDSLHLDPTEKKALIAFLHSLDSR